MDLPFSRDDLGRHVRDAWIRWAKSQPEPKASWLVPYDELPERDKEADRQIGEAVALLTKLAIDAHLGSPIHDKAEEAAKRLLRRYHGNQNHDPGLMNLLEDARTVALAYLPD